MDGFAAAFPASLNLLVLDNGAGHKAKAGRWPSNVVPVFLPPYSPELHPIERFWRVLRRRATHNRLFASMAVLRTTLRNNLCYFQTMRQKVLSLIESPWKAQKAAKLTAVLSLVRKLAKITAEKVNQGHRSEN